MRRTVFICAALFVTAVAFSQSVLPAVRTRHVPPPPRDGVGADGIVAPVLIYHAIRPYLSTDTPAVKRYIATPQTFEEEMAWLKDNGYTSVTFDDLVATLSGGKQLPPKPVIISFDDSWEGQYTYAFPTLRKYGLTATFYTWVVMVGRKNHMSWDQVKELSDAGMAIGCHTMTHPYLTKIPTDAEMRWQIAHAKDVIEERIGKRITTFAYPFGQYDEKVVSFVKEAGFTSARSTWPGVVHTVEGVMSLAGLIRTESAMALEQAITEEMRATDASTARGAETILGLSDQESPLP